MHVSLAAAVADEAPRLRRLQPAIHARKGVRKHVRKDIDIRNGLLKSLYINKYKYKYIYIYMYMYMHIYIYMYVFIVSFCEDMAKILRNIGHHANVLATVFATV